MQSPVLFFTQSLVIILAQAVTKKVVAILAAIATIMPRQFQMN